MPKGILSKRFCEHLVNHLKEEQRVIVRDMAIVALLYRRLAWNGGLTPEERERGVPGGTNAT